VGPGHKLTRNKYGKWITAKEHRKYSSVDYFFPHY
jgi:hypothetical protein